MTSAADPPPPAEPRRPAPSANRFRSFAKYSGLAFQMLAVIGAFAWAGVWLDRHFHTKNPWWTVGLMLLGVLGAMAQIIRSLTRE